MGFYTSTGDTPDYADDVDGPDPFDGGAATFRTHRGRLVPSHWSDQRAELYADEQRRERADGTWDEVA